MTTRLLLFIAYIVPIFSSGDHSCSVQYYVPPVNLQESCSDLSRATIDDLQAQVAELSESLNRLRQNASTACPRSDGSRFAISYRDCQDVADYSEGSSGEYMLTPAKTTFDLITGNSADNNGQNYYFRLTETHGPFSTHCEISNDVGWTVIMRRISMDVQFKRSWIEYEEGFGDLEGDYWLGLAHIRALTSQPMTSYDLWIELKDKDGVPSFYPYRGFKLEGISYNLVLGQYFGRESQSLSSSNGAGFSCWTSDDSAARMLRSPVNPCDDLDHEGYGCWWYSNSSSTLCGSSDLNALKPFWSGFDSDVTSVAMKLKRN